MSQTKQVRFAYGEERYDGCECPAIAAGVKINVVSEVVELYDRKVASIVNDQSTKSGIVDEKIAKRAWVEAIKKLKRKHGDICEHPSKKAGEHVAEELGWVKQSVSSL